MALSLLLSILQLYIIVTQTKKNLTFIALANLKEITGAGAQWLAIQEINNNSDLLPNHTLHFKGTLLHYILDTITVIKPTHIYDTKLSI